MYCIGYVHSLYYVGYILSLLALYYTFYVPMMINHMSVHSINLLGFNINSYTLGIYLI